MSIWDALQALVHRWYVVVGGVVVAVMASYVALGAEGVYWTHAEVTFLAPTSAIFPNALRTTSSDLIITAGVVAKRVNGNEPWNQMADPAATIVGQGILEGSQVKLPDVGGQWARVYSRQVLDIQVSGPTAQDVSERRTELISRVEAELAVLQSDVAETDRITTTVVPAEPSIYYMHGSRVRALAMIWLLCGAGVLATIQILTPSMARQPWSGVVPPDRGQRHGRRSASRRSRAPSPPDATGSSDAGVRAAGGDAVTAGWRGPGAADS
jgi:hypothetical protein